MANSKRAIVLGGTEDHIKLIEILKSRGYYVVLIDYLAKCPASNIADRHIRESTLDADKVLKIAQNIDPEIVVTACIDQALLTMAYVCEKLGLPCHISYHIALMLTDKAYMKKIFSENKIPTSNFRIIHSPQNTNINEINFPVVVKPSDSNSSKGILKVTDREALDEALKYAFTFSRSRKVIVEEFVSGEEFSVDIAVEDSKPEILMVTKNIKLQLNKTAFTIAQNEFPATKDPELLEKIESIAIKIINAYDYKRGPLLIQMIYNGRDLNVLEFSSRIGGGSKHHFILKMTDFDILEWFVDILLNKEHVISATRNYSYGSMNYVYTTDGLIDRFEGFDELKEMKIIERYFQYKVKGMVVSDHKSSSDRPVGYLIVDNSYDSYLQKIDYARKNLKILDPNGLDIIIHEKQ